MAKDPATVASKWASRLGQSASDGTIQSGIQSVTVAPGQAAARQKTVWVNNTTQAADRWATNTAAVTVADWQSAAINKGLPRIATGATAATPKMQSVMAKLLPAIDAAKNSLPPRGDFNANLQRATAMATKLHALKGTLK